MTTKYQCKFRAANGAYSIDKYDLETNDEEEILEILEGDGYEVLEISDIMEQ